MGAGFGVSCAQRGREDSEGSKNKVGSAQLMTVPGLKALPVKLQSASSLSLTMVLQMATHLVH
jgi:hypothetical protein